MSELCEIDIFFYLDLVQDNSKLFAMQTFVEKEKKLQSLTENP